MKSKFSAPALALVLILVAPAARAVPIDYIFTGTGTGTLNGAAFDGGLPTFRSLPIPAPSRAAAQVLVTNTGTGAFFVRRTFSTTLATAEAVINSGTSFITLQFGQFQPPASFASEAIVDSVFALYNLDTAYPLVGPFTGGGINVQPQTYLTAAGDLDFTGISSLSFEAVEPSAVPLPASLPMMFAGLAALGAFAFMRRRSDLTVPVYQAAIPDNFRDGVFISGYF